MTEADNTMAAGLPPAQPAPAAVTLAGLAAALGEMEPADERADLTAEHCLRQSVLRAAAPLYPVTSAADAALAISAAAALLSQAVDSYCSIEEAHRHIRDARKVLARLGCWVDADLGEPPIWSSFLTADLDG
jgi:hypothetical protein